MVSGEVMRPALRMFIQLLIFTFSRGSLFLVVLLLLQGSPTNESYTLSPPVVLPYLQWCLNNSSGASMTPVVPKSEQWSLYCSCGADISAVNPQLHQKYLNNFINASMSPLGLP